MFETEVEEAQVLYNKLYKQAYPPSQIQFKYLDWFRGYIASECADKQTALLDVGCGRQVVKPEFLSFKRLSYFGLDIASEVDPFFCCSAHEIPLGDKYVDFIWSCDFIEHVPSNMIDPVFNEMNRVLSKKAMISLAAIPSGRVIGGKNLHLTVESQKWWEKKLDEFFKIDDIKEPQKDRLGFLLRGRSLGHSD